MSSTFGSHIKISIFGQSHSEAIGVNIDGLPAGYTIDMEKLQAFLDRRAPGRSNQSTSRKEADVPKFVSGLVDNVTCGAPLCAMISNNDVRSKDYDQMKEMPRPGHADYTAHVKYGGHEDVRGGGHFSGRLTAPLCVAGGILMQLLQEQGIEISASIKEMGDVEAAKAEGDSVGGIIGCTVTGLPAGVGEPMFDGVENKIAQVIFAIPGIKGIEFGRGFEAAALRGSENNDAFYVEDGIVKTRTNNHGGILGGITSGMPVEFRVAVKPTPSIAKSQKTVAYGDGTERTIEINGRHDPCIVPRAVPCVEAAAAIAIYDLLKGEFGNDKVR